MARGGSAGRCGGRGAPPGCSARRARGQRRASPVGGWRAAPLRSAPRGCGAMEAVDQVGSAAPRVGRGGLRVADRFSLIASLCPAARLRGDFPRGEGAAGLPQGVGVGECRVGR